MSFFGQVAFPAATNTYAILDAAEIVGLPDMLDVTGLARRCLLKDQRSMNLLMLRRGLCS